MLKDGAAPSEHSLDPDSVRFFTGRSHPELAAGIATYLSVPLDPTQISRFSNDNLYVQLGASVRGRAVFVVQSLTPPVSDHLVELLMMLDIARSAGARQVQAVIPYYSYARSDKKDAPRISITARLIADLLVTAGATHVMTMTLHSPQVHGFFSVPTDPLTARALFVRHFIERRFDPNDTVVVAPDVGHAKSAARFADYLDLPVAAGDKRRISDTEVEIGGLVGKQVKGFRRALIYDDEIATGGSVIELSRLLVDTGIQEILVICTHGLFVGNALERLSAVPQIIRDRHHRHRAPARRKTRAQHDGAFGGAGIRRGHPAQLQAAVNRGSLHVRRRRHGYVGGYLAEWAGTITQTIAAHKDGSRRACQHSDPIAGSVARRASENPGGCTTPLRPGSRWWCADAHPARAGTADGRGRQTTGAGRRPTRASACQG